MKSPQPNALARSLVKFFQEYLPTLRGMSTHTIHSCVFRARKATYSRQDGPWFHSMSVQCS
jgi:hypothetical protein